MGQALPADYVSKNNKIAQKRLVLAGHRLAKTIEMIFNPKTEEAVSDSFLQ
jgi:hypothetical protein